MNETKKNVRTRRRAFDREAGVAIAQALFHQRGYDAVGISELTKALNINPPSLYAAYNSKAGLFGRCLARYVNEGNLPADRILIPERPLAEAIKELFITAALLYAKSPQSRGCLVAEGMRADDEQARKLANQYAKPAMLLIEEYIRQSEPKRAKELGDFVVTALRGFSAAAVTGLSRPRLLNVARMNGQAFAALLSLHPHT
ncbi:TetR/AcrR family transcriptional regulator (plasmid) [Enterobacter hormaechei]|uniref:TetR/AcrR family transcriptional regulator n=1 Tax=Enterobacter hormaechei TaxID=158836 RepID=UPI00125D5BA1|nr:TetR/AcrR family transcriptional regulator [Enterobacter hormaechei]QFH87811.1 TetR/AcrR family transcriptional regulator [Enterobacter hormaechei]